MWECSECNNHGDAISRRTMWDLPPEDDPSREVPRPPVWPMHEDELTAETVEE